MLRAGVHSAKFAGNWLKVSIATRGFHCSQATSAIHFYPNQSDVSTPNQSDVSTEPSKPIVLLFGWLLAKSKHLEKYAEMYQKYGADIMTIHLEVSEVLRPKKAEQTAVKVLEQLTSSDHNDKPVIVHGFSVGGYLYSQVVNQIVNNTNFKTVERRILGQVFDSPVDFPGIPHGISNAATKNPVLRSLMKNGIKSYLATTSKYTSKVFIERSKLFVNMPIQCPSMFLFSKSDAVSDSTRIHEISDHWKHKLDIEVTKKCWDESQHVSHFYSHPEEYKKLVNSFVKQVLPAKN